MSDETRDAGWHTDPAGRFSHRYFDGTNWTEHVSDEGTASSDQLAPPPPPPSAPRASVAAAVGGSVAVVTLPDSPKAIQNRLKFGWIMVGCAGVILLSLALPWVSGAPQFSRGAPHTLAGYEFSGGGIAGFAAVALGLYGWQGIAKPRVRFHVWALVGVFFLMTGTLFYAATITDDELLKLDVAGSAVESHEFLGGAVVFSTGPGDPRSTNPYGAAELVDGEIGITVAVFAGFAAIWPLTVLWREDRSRRREAGLLL
jgi:hypothetical protein